VLEYINSYTVIGYYLPSIASYEVIRSLILLGTVIINIFKIGLGNTSLTSISLANSNGNMPPILECNPLTHIVMSSLDHSSRHLATIPQPSLVIPNKVTWGAHLVI
jgi:hypothetical protein